MPPATPPQPREGHSGICQGVREMIGRTPGVRDDQGAIALEANVIARERRPIEKHVNVCELYI